MTNEELDDWMRKKEAEHAEWDRKHKLDADRLARLLRIMQKEQQIEAAKRREKELGKFVNQGSNIQFVHFDNDIPLQQIFAEEVKQNLRVPFPF